MILIPVDGQAVIHGEQSGIRYAFTPERRTLTVDDRDVDQFDAKHIQVNRCGCGGGEGAIKALVKVFQISM
jgi:hypothetical protein